MGTGADPPSPHLSYCTAVPSVAFSVHNPETSRPARFLYARFRMGKSLWTESCLGDGRTVIIADRYCGIPAMLKLFTAQYSTPPDPPILAS